MKPSLLKKFQDMLSAGGFEWSETDNGTVTIVEKHTNNCVEFESWDAVMDQHERATADAQATNHRRDFKVIHGGK